VTRLQIISYVTIFALPVHSASGVATCLEWWS